MNRGTKGVSLLLTATLAVSGPISVPATALAAEDTSTPAELSEGAAPAADEAATPAVQVSTYAELQAALKAASTDAENPTRIQLNADIEATGTTGLAVLKGTFVELSSAPGHIYTIKQTGTMNTATQGMFLISGSLTLGNVVLDINGKGRGAYILVGTTTKDAFYGQLTLNDGATITNGVCLTNVKQGLGVYVNSNTTAETMGRLIMNPGSKITNCTANLTNTQAQGLAVYVNGGRFDMAGGEISGNKDAMTQSTTTSYAQGTVYVNSSLSNSSSALADIDNFVMTGGVISDNAVNFGGAVYMGSYAHADFQAGVIENNVARFAGGAIAAVGMDYNSATTLRYSDVAVGKGMVLRDNTATNGGAIYAADGVVTVDGATLTGNKATADKNICPSHLNSATSVVSSTTGFGTGSSLADGDGCVAAGGAIYVADARLTVANATITGNEAVSTWAPEEGSEEAILPAGNGGGIYVGSRKGCSVEHGVTIQNSNITGNSASGPGTQSGFGADVCAAFNPYDKGVDEVYLVGTDAVVNEEGEQEGISGLTIGGLGIMNALNYRYQEYAVAFDGVSYAAPVVGLQGKVSIDSTRLAAPVADHPEASVALYALTALEGTVGFDTAGLAVGTPVILGANGYLLRTADLNRMKVAPAAEGKALGFDEAGNVMVADAANPQFDISDTAAISVAEAVYNGEQQKPAVTVTVGEKVLEPSEYSVAYVDNVDAGEATAVVNGRGAYTGTVEVKFPVQPRALSASGVSVAPLGDLYATGNAVEPSLSVSDDGVTLVQGTDYEVTYRENTEAGAATAVLSGVGNYTGTVEVPFTIKAVPDTMKSVANEEQLKEALADSSVEGIALAADFELAAPVTVARPVFVSGDGHRITYAGDAAEAMIEVAEGGALTLSDAALTGGVITGTTAKQGTRTLYIHEGGSATLSNVELQGKRNASGVSVYNAGTVTMTDVLVKDAINSSSTASTCYEGVLYNAGTMTLGSGVRFENSISRRGYVFNVGTLEINGGEYCGSTGSTSAATGSWLAGAAITAASGTVVMNDGLISGNSVSAPVVVRGGAVFTMNGGRIVENAQSAQTGAVYVASFASDSAVSRFVMNGGLIANNTNISTTSLTCNGGGVYLNGNKSEFEMNGGEISGNSAFQGGGVGVYGGSFTMNDGVIKDNVATITSKSDTGSEKNKGYAQGGGVAVMSSAAARGSFTMNGGSIEGNTAELRPLTITSQVDFDFTGLGGGVYVMGADFIMKGGSITNNTAAFDGPKDYGNSALGGGVYVADYSTTIRSNVSLEGTITDNKVLGRMVLAHNGDGADVYVDRCLNLSSTAVNGSPTVAVGGAFKAGEVRLAGTATYLTVTAPFAEGAGISHLVADDRATAGSQIAKVADGVTMDDACLAQMGYDSQLGLALSKDDPSKIVLGTLNLASEEVKEIELGSTDFTGKPINPAGLLDATVTLKNGEQIVVPKLNDITVTQNSDHTEPGVVNVTLKGEGGLVEGEVETTYTITPRDLATSGFTVQLGDEILAQAANGKFSYSGEAFPATGEQLTPEVKIALDNLEGDDGRAWIDPEYIEVEYGTNTEPGTSGTVTLKAKEGVEGQRYRGSTTVSFQICGKPLADLATNVPATTPYTGAAQFSTTAVKLYDADGNELKYSTDYSVSSGSRINAGTYTLTITGKGAYAYRTRTITFDIVPLDLAQEGVATLSATEVPYTGSTVTAPTFTVGSLTATLRNNNTTTTYTDAEGNAVTSTDLVAAGKYYAVIDGKKYGAYENVVGQARVPFYIGLESLDVTGGPETGACRPGDEFDLGYSSAPADSKQLGDLAWTSSNPAVATVDENGHVKALDDGAATITVSAGGQSSSFELTVARVLMSDCDVDWGVEDYTYDGTAKEPQVSVSNGDEQLVAGIDYTVRYENNVNAGTAKVIIEGNGVEFGGTLEKEFAISPASISGANAWLAYTSAVYSEDGVRPSVTVEGLNALTDYTVDYMGYYRAGEAYAFVMGKGNYTGWIKLPYTIERADIADVPMWLSQVSMEYDPWGSNQPALRIFNNLNQTVDYYCSYLGGGGVGSQAIGVHTVLVQGTGNYKGSKTLTYEVVPSNINKAMVSGLNSEYAPTGKPINPDFFLVFTSGLYTDTLVSGADYVVNTYNNIDEGTATMVITGIGGFTGTMTANFLIKKGEAAAPNPDDQDNDDETSDPNDPLDGGNITEPKTGNDADDDGNGSEGGQPAPGSGGGSNVDKTGTGSSDVSPTSSLTGRTGTGTGASGGISATASAVPGNGTAGSDEDAQALVVDGALPESGISATSASGKNVEAIADDGTPLVDSEGRVIGSEAAMGDEISPEMVALISFLVLACALGGFLLYRYLTGRKPEGEEQAEEAAAEQTTGVY